MKAQRNHADVVHPSPTPSLEGRGLRSVSGGFQFFEDCSEDAIGILQHVVVPEADYAVAVGFDDRGAVVIGGTVGVLAAIELDRDPRRTVGEIDNEIADRQLARGFKAIQLTRPQVRPQSPLGIGHVASQLARDAGQSFCRQNIAPSKPPSPWGKGWGWGSTHPTSAEPPSQPFPTGEGLFSLPYKARNAQTH